MTTLVASSNGDMYSDSRVGTGSGSYSACKIHNAVPGLFVKVPEKAMAFDQEMFKEMIQSGDDLAATIKKMGEKKEAIEESKESYKLLEIDVFSLCGSLPGDIWDKIVSNASGDFIEWLNKNIVMRGDFINVGIITRPKDYKVPAIEKTDDTPAKEAGAHFIFIEHSLYGWTAESIVLRKGDKPLLDGSGARPLSNLLGYDLGLSELELLQYMIDCGVDRHSGGHVYISSPGKDRFNVIVQDDVAKKELSNKFKAKLKEKYESMLEGK